MKRPPVQKPRAMYRMLRQGPPVEVITAWGTMMVHIGDFVYEPLISKKPPEVRKRFAMPMHSGKLSRKLGRTVEEGQPIVSSHDASPKPPEARPVEIVDAPAPTSIKLVEFHGLDQLRAELSEDLDSPVLLIDEGVLCPLGEERTAALLSASSEADIVFPGCNLSAPYDLPLVGDLESRERRFLGGWSVFEIAEILSKSSRNVVSGAPNSPCAALLSPKAIRNIVYGEDSNLTTVICLNAFVRRHRNVQGELSRLLGGVGDATASIAFRNAAEAARAVVAESPVTRPPVVFFTDVIGHYGGVIVLFKLVDELQKLGVHAMVVHKYEQPHRLDFLTPPLKIRDARLFATEWPRWTGSRHGIFVASNWKSGQVARTLAECQPGIISTCFFQDREDRFETPSGKLAGMRHYEDYIAMNRGVAVAEWIVDSLVDEFGKDSRDYDVICPGIDPDVFFPPESRKKNEQVRVLAMWRAMTAARRGIPRLKKTFDALHEKYGEKVSLELFGWEDRKGEGKAPTYAKMHGNLSQDEVAELMREVDIVVEPSDFQGFGLTGLEAMACGACLVSTDCDGPREYAIHEENALLVPHDDLFEAVCRAIDDGDLRDELAAEGVVTAQEFHWPKIAKKWARFLAALWKRGGFPQWKDEWSDIEERASR